MVDLRPLGFTRHHVLLALDHSTRDIHTLCRELATSPSAIWIPSYIGTFDTQVIVDSHAKLPLHEILADLFMRTKARISEYEVFTDEEDLEFQSVLPGMPSLDLSALSDEPAFLGGVATASFAAKREFSPCAISALEVRILQQLSQNPRLSMNELGDKAGCDRVTARRRVLGLIKAGVVLGFGAGFDHLALGFHAYHLLFRLQPTAPREAIRGAFIGQPGVFYAGRVRGAYDLSVYLYARQPAELMAWVSRMREAFGKYITRYDLLLYDAVHHWRQVTEAAVRVMGVD